MEKPPTLINLLIHPLPPTLGGFCPAFSSDQNCLVQDEINNFYRRPILFISANNKEGGNR
jgi:hypothetical protein